MKRRKIIDSVELPTKTVLSLIKVFTNKFGTPKRHRHIKHDGYISFIRFSFIWSFGKKKMKNSNNPPNITMSIMNNAVFSKNSKNPASKDLYRKLSTIKFFGYNDSNYKKYTEIMNRF